METAEPVQTGAPWVRALGQAVEQEELRSLVTQLAVEPLPRSTTPCARNVVSYPAALQQLLRSCVRSPPSSRSCSARTRVEEQLRYNQMFSELVVLEARRKQLQTRSIGGLE